MQINFSHRRLNRIIFFARLKGLAEYTNKLILQHILKGIDFR